MPRTDPANDRANARSAIGLSRELQQARTDIPPDPSIGGTRGYPPWFRIRAIAAANVIGEDQASIQYGCSARSIRRWRNRLDPYRMTGGVEREALTGMDQLLLTIGLFVYPAATEDQLCAFILVNGGDIYTREQISERCKDLQLTRKRCSKEAFDAFSPRTLRRLRWFKTLPPPLGVRGVQIRRLIDVDETGFYLRDLGSNYGRGAICQRVRVPRHYTRSDPKVNVILAIEPGDPNLPAHVDGSIQKPRRWLKITTENVDQFVFGDFCDSIFTDLENNPVDGGGDNDRGIMWDNLSAHKTPYVIHMIEGRESPNVFWTMDRPPYMPKIAPIEYVFCELANELGKVVQRGWTIEDLKVNIRQIVARLGQDGKFQNTFIHCGYPF